MVDEFPLDVQRILRKLFVLAQGRPLLRLPFAWEIPNHKYGNMAPVRLYFVPTNSPFKGHIVPRSIPLKKK